jgi:hypothetical protein
VVVGMGVSGTGIPSGATIITVTNSSNITMSAVATASGVVTCTFTGTDTIISLSAAFSAGGATTATGNLTFYGKEIEPQAYMSMDAVDSPKGKKCFHNVTAIYKHTPTGGVSNTENSTLSLRFSRDKNRASVVSHTLSPHAVTDEYNRLVIELSQDERSPGEVGEFEVRHDGRGSSQVELIGLEAEVEVLDSLT